MRSVDWMLRRLVKIARERDRKRETERERKRDRYREREIDRETGRQTKKEKGEELFADQVQKRKRPNETTLENKRQTTRTMVVSFQG